MQECWGLGLPEDVSDDRLWWSARAILHSRNGLIELLPDRMGFNRYEKKDEDRRRRLDLADWISDTIKRIDAYSLDPTKQQLHEVETDKYKMIYDTRGSHGYLYISAWEKDNGLSEENPGLEQTSVG